MAQQTRTLMTAEQLESLPDDNLRRELVRGEVIEMTPAAAESGRIGGRIAMSIGAHAAAGDLGIMYIPDAGFLLAHDPDTVRMPDVAFVAKRRAALHPPAAGFFPGAPDLAVEVVSPTDSATDLQLKVTEYLEAGTQLVWVVYPTTRQVAVYTPGMEVTVIPEGGTLLGDPVLPGLSIPVAEIFAL
jgi:Uma2 family endonuclease